MKLLEWFRHLFVPHRSNNHRARILHPSVLSVVVAAFLIYQFTLNFALLLRPSILGYAANISPEKVIELTNQERLRLGLPPLKINPVLSQAAQLKAGDMFAFDYWAHTSPSGRTPWVFFREAGYSYTYAGENLARDFQNSESVVQAWMNSPTHRDNIVNDKYQEIGLAVVDGSLDGTETTLVVQLFGTPTPTPTPVAETLSSASSPIPMPTKVSEQAATVLPTATPSPTAPLDVSGPGQTEKGLSLVPTDLAQASIETSSPPLLSPFWLTKVVSVLLLGIVFGVLTLDVYLVYRKKIVRLSGRNVAHLIFIAALLLTVILTTQGMVL